MEDMKGDMAGAACVVGLMQALAAARRKVNASAPSARREHARRQAQRPGDIVTTMSGQTIEIINTDAEGRLVLADVLRYVTTRFKPAFMVDLRRSPARSSSRLGMEYAGCSQRDRLAERLPRPGRRPARSVWRMPLGPDRQA
jgi:leucyl aminopeptidase